MAKRQLREVEILHFFERESLAAVTVLFNVLEDVMRTRLRGDGPQSETNTPGKRRSKVGRLGGQLVSELKPDEETRS